MYTSMHFQATKMCSNHVDHVMAACCSLRCRRRKRRSNRNNWSEKDIAGSNVRLRFMAAVVQDAWDNQQRPKMKLVRLDCEAVGQALCS